MQNITIVIGIYKNGSSFHDICQDFCIILWKEKLDNRLTKHRNIFMRHISIKLAFSHARPLFYNLVNIFKYCCVPLSPAPFPSEGFPYIYIYAVEGNRAGLRGRGQRDANKLHPALHVSTCLNPPWLQTAVR